MSFWGAKGKAEINAHQTRWTYSMLNFHSVVSQMVQAAQHIFWLWAKGQIVLCTQIDGYVVMKILNVAVSVLIERLCEMLHPHHLLLPLFLPPWLSGVGLQLVLAWHCHTVRMHAQPMLQTVSFNLQPKDTHALKAGSSHEEGHTVEGKGPERCGVSASTGLQDVPAAQLLPSTGVSGFTDSCKASTE